MVKVSLLGVVLVAAATTQAFAEPDVAATASTDRSTHSHVEAIAGLATPVGELGVEYTLVTQHHLEIGFGVGMATLLGPPSIRPDLQVAIMPRYRTRIGPGTVTLGAGLSAGHYTVLASPFASDPILEKTSALWANGEAGYELCLMGGIFARAYLGVGQVIAHGAVTDSRGAPQMSLTDSSLPYAGIGLGYAF